MKLTKLINISGLPFYIEEDAYTQLNDYLEQLKKYFAGYEESEEIVNDIETRFAEKLSETLTDQKKVITSKEVSKIIESMGTPKDFEYEEGKESHESEAKQDEVKKLFRNTDDQIIAGVASGIAAYLNIDPFIVRLVFFIFALTGGASILLYIILWIYMPEAKTITDKVQMKGDAVTLSNIENTIKKNLKDIKDRNTWSSKIGTAMYKLTNAFFNFLRLIKPLIFTISGLISSIIGGFIIFTLSTTLFTVLFVNNSKYVDPILNLVPNTFLGFCLLFFAYLTLVIPAFFILNLGISLIRRKYLLKQSVNLALFAVWFLAGIIATSLTIKFYPEVKSAYERDTVTLNKEFTNFDKISVRNGIDVTVDYGENYSVEVTGNKHRIDETDFEIKDNELILKRKSILKFCLLCFGDTDVKITMPALKEIKLENASTAEIENLNNTDLLKIHLKNASELEIEGKAVNLEVLIENASTLEAVNLLVVNAEVRLKNASSAELNVSEILNASIENASELEYKGNPKLYKDKDDSSEIERID